VNVRLERNGWTTGFVGKFLNEYEYYSPTPPGWSEWRPVFLDAYDGWGFGMRGADGSLEYVPIPDASLPRAERDRLYAGNVIADIAVDFVRRHRDDGAPYFLEVATYAPHVRTNMPKVYADDPRFPPALVDRPRPGRPAGNCGAVPCGRLGLDELPGFGDPRKDNRPRFDDGRQAPAWRTNDVTVTARAAVTSLRNQARMVQSVDRMLARLLREVGSNTYVVLTSDNGFHLGQHGLERGKGTPYDSDVRVPLVVTGPGVRAGVRRDPVSNIDIAPTVEALAGLRPTAFRAGRSFLRSLRDPAVVRERTVFFEHTHAPSLGGDDPDRWYAGGTHDLIPSYVAARSRDGLLVRVDLDNSWQGTRFAWEYYDYADAVFEETNTVHLPAKREQVRRLRRSLEAFLACRDARRDERVTGACRRAM
jgi:arylsulfatase A-like enzyme